MNRKKRDGLKLLLILILGMVLGFLMKELFRSLNIDLLNINFVTENILIIQIILVFLLYLPVIIWTQQGKKYYQKTNQEIDIEEDLDRKKADQLMLRARFFNRSYLILNFVTIGLALDYGNDLLIASLLIFIVFGFLTALNEVKIIRVKQAHDPMKKGDPTSLNFNKVYFSSLDEGEKTKVYQATHHTFRFMEVGLIALMVVAIILKESFNQGNSPIVMIGLTWLLQSVAYFYYTKKFE